MNYQAKPFPAGCDQQSRYVTRVVRTSGDEPWHLPHMEAGALLMAEDAMGICDTCPGELDSPEAVFQAEPAAQPKWQVTALLGRCAINLLGASVGLMALLLLSSAFNSALTKWATS